MIDSERFKLLYGPYLPPKCQEGDKLRCEHRGREVRVGAISDAPIRWPCAWAKGPRSPILCGELIRAVRLESAIAVAHHWGVNRATVSIWRRGLKVARMTLGSIRLRIDYSSEILTPEVRALAATARRFPHTWAKIRLAKLGQPRGSKRIATRHEADRPPGSDAWTRELSERTETVWEPAVEHGSRPGNHRSGEEPAVLAKEGDGPSSGLARSLACALGSCPSSVVSGELSPAQQRS